MCVGAASVCSRLEVRSSNRSNDPEVRGEIESWKKPSKSKSLSDSATCFQVVAGELGSSAPGGRVLMTTAESCNRVVRDAGGSVVYLGGTNTTMFARRCTFAFTPRAETSWKIDGDSTEAAWSGRLAENCVKKGRGSRFGRRGRVKMC